MQIETNEGHKRGSLIFNWIMKSTFFVLKRVRPSGPWRHTTTQIPLSAGFGV